MKFVMSPYCDVCGKPRGGRGKVDHSKCSKIRQQSGGEVNSPSGRKLGVRELEYLTRIGSE